MPKINREDIHKISRHSNWPVNGVDQALKDWVYNDIAAWKKFLRLFFISLGVCFTTSGVVFFFAYNWADLHKFAKIGLLEGLVVSTAILVLISRINPLAKKILLTGTCVLVGALFAVFGQVYQTGANAYDFFLGWTVFITVWVLISDFAPLWLLYFTLLHVTLWLFAQQVATDWPEVLVFTWHFLLSVSFLFVFIFLSRYRKQVSVPVWFIQVVALAVIYFATTGIIIGIFATYDISFLILVLITGLVYVAGIAYGLKHKSIFYLAGIFLSLIIIMSAVIIHITHEAGVFLFTGLFIIAAVSLLIRFLVAIQKKWLNE